MIAIKIFAAYQIPKQLGFSKIIVNLLRFTFVMVLVIVVV
jgi:hypothetical protein